MAEQRTRLVYIGSYTADSSGGGHGTGISVWRHDPQTGELHAAGPDTPVSGPSFLTWHPTGDFLYSVNERPDGAVTALAVDDGALRVLGEQPTGGADPCHLSVDPTGRYLVTANYTSGSVVVHPIDADGSLGARSDLVQHQARGDSTADDARTPVVRGRQDGPHCHQVRFDPAGRTLLVNDLGTDQVYGYRLDEGQLEPVAVTELARGTGPRHLVFAGERAWLAAELASTVSALQYRPETGTVTLVDQVDATGRHGEAPNYPSEIVLSDDGRHLYVANRGENTVAVFAVGAGGLRRTGEVDCGGDWPRHLMLLGDHLYVANQRSDAVTVFRLDPDSGQATRALTVPVPSPACLLAGR